MVLYILIFIYFFADTVLCQDLNSDEITGIQDNLSSCVAQEAQEAQKSLVDPEIRDRLKELKAISESNSHQVNERLNALDTLYDNDIVKVNE
jgi:hypothetical protein